MTEERLHRRLSAILAADVVGYSRMMERDEAQAHLNLKALRQDVFVPLAAQFGGRIFKNTGDGALVEYSSAVDAVHSAVEMQRALAARNAEAPEHARIELRIGISLGDVIVDGDDLYGNGVNIAVRIEGLAKPGGICVSGNVRDQVMATAQFEFENLGEQQVKNIAMPIKAYMIRAADQNRPVPAAGPASQRWTRRGGIAGALIAAAVAVSWAGYEALTVGDPATGRSETAASSRADDQPEAKLSVAVLPFTNLSGDPGQDYFIDGITENLITDLSRIAGAFVISRNTSFTYRGQAIDVRQIGRELGVRNVLEGSVSRSDERVRVNAQLISTRTGAHVWADRFDVAVEDIYAVQDQITGRIARALNMELKEQMSRRAALGRPEDLDAVDLATRAWAILFNKPQSAGTNAEVAPLLERALELDPKNAEAWTGLSYMHTRAAVFGWSPSRAESLRLAVDAGERAIKFDARSADAYYVLAFALRRSGDWSRARELNKRCIELNPNFAPCYFALGVLEIYEGRPGETIPLIKKAFQLSPRDGLAAVWHAWAGQAYVLVGDDSAAIVEARAGIAQNPKYPNCYAVLAAGLALRGEIADARAALDQYVAMRRDLSISDWIRNERLSDDMVGYYARFLDGLRAAGLPE
jgi:TolB-like protein/class 3 adenylate cyclase/Flp pilus assembly protein TadD